jgi:hypothetical protein
VLAFRKFQQENEFDQICRQICGGVAVIQKSRS